MGRATGGTLGLGLAAMLGLASCAGLGTPFRTKAMDPMAAPPVTSVGGVDRDVEAPKVFDVTDQALWDGRPSLGGIWVASPDAKDPERVIMRNPSNGKVIVGALFRRERNNPGPPLQISSDAAAALGLLAGQPGRIKVTALRREEAAPPVEDGTLVEVGQFATEAKARAAADKLAKAGVPAEVQPGTGKDATVWRVVAGPGSDGAGLVATVKVLGYADAAVLPR